MFDQLFDLKLEFLESVGSRLPGHVEFQHFSQTPVDQVFTCFQFAHSHSPLSAFPLADDVHHRPFSFFRHGAFCDFLQHLPHCGHDAVLILEPSLGLAPRHLQTVLGEEALALLDWLAVVESHIAD